MTVFGLDVSHHNGRIDWAAVHRGGIRFMIAKASQGQGYSDPMFLSHCSAARATGLLTGAYHFLTRAPAAAQAKHFLDRVHSAGDPAGMLLAVDVEDPGSEPEPRFADVQAFVAEFRRRLPHHPLILYTGGWYWNGHLPNPAGARLDCPLWLSRYVSGAGAHTTLYSRVPEQWWRPGFGGWDRVTLLQFSDRARVAEHTGDVSAYRGSIDQLRALAGGPTITLQEDDMPSADDVWNHHIKDPKKRHPEWSAAALLSSAYLEARGADGMARKALAEVGALKATLARLVQGQPLTAEQITAAAEAGARAALDSAVDADPAMVAGDSAA